MITIIYMADNQEPLTAELVPTDKALHIQVIGELRRQVLHAAIELDCTPEEFCSKAIAAAVKYVQTRDRDQASNTSPDRVPEDVWRQLLKFTREKVQESEALRSQAGYTRGRF